MSESLDSPTCRLGARLPITRAPLTDFPDDPLVCMRRLHEEHGSIAALEDGGQRILFVFHPEYNQRVLCDKQVFHSRFFALRGSKRSSQRRLSSGLLTMNGDEHKEHRRMVMPPFLKPFLPRYHDAIGRITTELLDSWEPKVRSPRGFTVDVNDEMTRYMLRLTASLLFGVDDPEVALHVGEMIDRWVEMNNELGIGAFVPDEGITQRYDELMHLAEELEVAVREMIDIRRPFAREGNDVLSLLIQAHDDHQAISTDELIGHVTLMYGAAHLTTAHTFTWTLMLLAQHPSVAHAVLEEISSVVDADMPTQEQLPQLALVERIVKESMRILPASCYLHRTAAEATQLGPFEVARGTPVVFSQFMTHHLSEFYDDPEAFVPDRWKTISPGPYAYLPFGNGPRMCLGAPLAMMILKTALPMMLKRFRVGMVPGTVLNGKMKSTMLGPITPVMTRIVPQDGRYQAQPIAGNIHSMVDLREMPRVSVEQRRAA